MNREQADGGVRRRQREEPNHFNLPPQEHVAVEQPPLQQPLQLDMDMEEEEIERVMMDLDPQLNGEVLEFHPDQLICYENYGVYYYPCQCHNYLMIDTGMSFHGNAYSDMAGLAWTALQADLEVSGVYFVAYWAASMFYDFHPVFIDRETTALRGMSIHVMLGSRLKFINTVCKLCEMGLIPCHYLRKMTVQHNTNRLILHSETWFGDIAQILLHWQRTECDRISSLTERV
ncbi:ORF22 [Aviadenovirus phalacrocoracidae]|uniref:ORF22 n=1 Tax=Aviadenovirus sp. TaxID=2217649 RepID=A0ABZ0T6E1_9ADEN|nr:ORF22 [Aviadenovirus sp.]